MSRTAHHKAPPANEPPGARLDTLIAALEATRCETAQPGLSRPERTRIAGRMEAIQRRIDRARGIGDRAIPGRRA